VKVLLADDQESSLSLMRLLVEREDKEVLLAKNVQEAIDILLEHQPELAIIDLLMPGDSNGVDLVHFIRETPEIAGTRVVITTAGMGDFTARDALEAGADAFLSKPFTVKQWKDIVGNFY